MPPRELRPRGVVVSAAPCYGSDALRARARTLAGLFGSDAELFTYFHNDPRACAPRDARRFARACDLAGLSATRRPRPDETKLR